MCSRQALSRQMKTSHESLLFALEYLRSPLVHRLGVRGSWVVDVGSEASYMLVGSISKRCPSPSKEFTCGPVDKQGRGRIFTDYVVQTPGNGNLYARLFGRSHLEQYCLCALMYVHACFVIWFPLLYSFALLSLFGFPPLYMRLYLHWPGR